MQWCYRRMLEITLIDIVNNEKGLDRIGKWTRVLRKVLKTMVKNQGKNAKRRPRLHYQNWVIKDLNSHSYADMSQDRE